MNTIRFGHHWAATTGGIMALVALTASGCGHDTAGTPTGVANVPAATATPALTASGAPTGSTVTCGSGTSAPDAAHTASDSPTPEGISRSLHQIGWWGGMSITVRRATVNRGGALTLDVTYANLGDQAASPSATATIRTASKSIETTSTVPEIPGGGNAPGTITADLADTSCDLSAVLDNVALIYGGPADNQTTIPLNPATSVDSVAPRTVPLTTHMAQDQIQIDPSGATITPSYVAGERNKTTVAVKIKVTCGSSCAAGGYNVDREEFSLRAPDGSTVTADTRSPYCCDALYPETVSDSARNILVFVVASPVSGKYTLSYNNKQLTDAGTLPAVADLAL
ncbi:hypothetical protein ACIP5Y_19210 [Nocardia sp. NPDC088792]|uniref:hypothetical protein n=1 Tax=Nocardia sp. NPDC088792 TaxID=3364332 RepID=UPI003805668F